MAGEGGFVCLILLGIFSSNETGFEESRGMEYSGLWGRLGLLSDSHLNTCKLIASLLGGHICCGGPCYGPVCHPRQAVPSGNVIPCWMLGATPCSPSLWIWELLPSPSPWGEDSLRINSLIIPDQEVCCWDLLNKCILTNYLRILYVHITYFDYIHFQLFLITPSRSTPTLPPPPSFLSFSF